jgi:hypothetical protein
MCLRASNETWQRYRFRSGFNMGYDAALAAMKPGGALADPEALNGWDKRALAEENDDCDSLLDR